MTNPTIEDVFSRLDEWRGFPAYQLERRADIYFALFLPFVLMRECFGLASKPKLIPEFPLRHGTLEIGAEANDGGERVKNRSKKVDYVAVSKDAGRVFLVELKTDIKSRDADQDDYLQKASTKTFKELVDGVYALQKAAKKNGNKETKRKYANLVSCLNSIDPDGSLQGVKPEVVYVQPKKDDPPSGKSHASYIYFAKFAELIKGRGEIADRFAESLEKWQEPPA